MIVYPIIILTIDVTLLADNISRCCGNTVYLSCYDTTIIKKTGYRKNGGRFAYIYVYIPHRQYINFSDWFSKIAYKVVRKIIVYRGRGKMTG